MENKERVLAYTMAKSLDQNELAEVSGGMHMTHTSTAGPSGSYPGSWDVHVDISVDW